MAEARIHVDVHNPGQVFACLGFLEVVDVLTDNAEARFDWSVPGETAFYIRCDGDQHPVVVALDFVANAQVQQITPGARVTYPARSDDELARPIELVCSGIDRRVSVRHWADESSCNPFKLYSGNRSATDIAEKMIHGARAKAKKGQVLGELMTKGIGTLWQKDRAALMTVPLDVLTPIGGSFNFDPRGGWTAIDTGYSPNDQSHSVEASPVVEMFAAIGLEHARPAEFEVRAVRYAIWDEWLCPVLARPALAGATLPFQMRRFRFVLALSGKNKVVTTATEEL